MREHGILKSESKHYISLAHTEADVAITLEAFDAAIAALTARPADGGAPLPSKQAILAIARRLCRKP